MPNRATDPTNPASITNVYLDINETSNFTVRWEAPNDPEDFDTDLPDLDRSIDRFHCQLSVTWDWSNVVRQDQKASGLHRTFRVPIPPRPGRLHAAINNSVPSFDVDERDSPYSGGASMFPFDILIGSEVMQVTNRVLVSGNRYTYTVARAQVGTTAASHGINAVCASQIYGRVRSVNKLGTKSGWLTVGGTTTGVAIDPIPTLLHNVKIAATDASSVPLTIQDAALAGLGVNVTEWYDKTGAPMAYMDNVGSVYSVGGGNDFGFHAGQTNGWPAGVYHNEGLFLFNDFGDNSPRVSIFSIDGSLAMGPGAAPGDEDAWIYRSGAHEITLDDVGGAVVQNGLDINWGGAGGNGYSQFNGNDFISLAKKSADPAGVAAHVMIYCKLVSGTLQLFARGNSAGVNVQQLTTFT